jgi:hypothetical protein
VVWLGLIALYGLAIALLVALVMRLMANWRLGDLRDAIVNRAYASWMYQGEELRGVKPGAFARVTVRLLGRGTR